jgi:hypothetical protein
VSCVGVRRRAEADTDAGAREVTTGWAEAKAIRRSGKEGATHKCLRDCCELDRELASLALGQPCPGQSTSKRPHHQQTQHCTAPIPTTLPPSSRCLQPVAQPPAPRPPLPPANPRNHIQGLTRDAVVVPPTKPPPPLCRVHLRQAARIHSS